MLHWLMRNMHSICSKHFIAKLILSSSFSCARLVQNPASVDNSMTTEASLLKERSMLENKLNQSHSKILYIYLIDPAHKASIKRFLIMYNIKERHIVD